MLVRLMIVSVLTMWTALAIGQLLAESGYPVLGAGWMGTFLFLALVLLTWKEFGETNVGIGLASAVILGGAIMWILGGTPLSALAPPLCYFLFGRIIFRRFVGNYSAVPRPDPHVPHWDDE